VLADFNEATLASAAKELDTLGELGAGEQGDVVSNKCRQLLRLYFEELTPERFDRQLSVSLIGPMNVTRAVLPVMRKQRAGHIISISSSAGLVGRPRRRLRRDPIRQSL
jgi:NAD(P)-dependent dehydrogenase (short-subunit alcohol dehydrogenase family)